MTAAVVGNSRSEIDDLDRLRGPYTTSDRQKDRTKWRPIRLGLGGRGAGRNLRIVLDLGSNSVTGDAVFAGYGQEVGMPAAGTYWPRGGGPCNGGFFVFFFAVVVFPPIPSNCIAPFVATFVVTTATTISR